MNPVRRLGLVAHPDRPEAAELVAHTIAWGAEHGVAAAEVDGAPDDYDAVLSFGGDGTMLRAVDLVAERGVPVLGVNCGQMGYLTGVEPDGLDDALERLRTGAFEVSERTVLAVDVVSTGPTAGRWTALNEAVVEKPHPGRLVRFEVVINGAPFTSYAADGVIVATPTGSTAYSFSAGGPIVSPRLACILLTPVSPHMLFDRTLVLDETDELELHMTERPALLTVDGRELGELEPGAIVRASCADVPARMITFAPRDFHQILKAKFGLADR
ncbi:MAG: NAD(+)/NADH kinase [Acidimicrobiia bacterium]